MSRFKQYMEIIQEMQIPKTNTIGILNFLKKIIELQEKNKDDKIITASDVTNIFEKYFVEKDLKDFIFYCVNIKKGNIDDVVSLILKEKIIKDTAKTLYPLLSENRKKISGIIINKIKDLMEKQGMNSFLLDIDSLTELAQKIA